LAWFGDVGVIYATVVMTILIVVFAEVLPKTAAFNAPNRIALAVARPVDWTVRLLTPVLIAVAWLVKRVLRLAGMKAGEHELLLSPHEELRGARHLLPRAGWVARRGRQQVGGLAQPAT